MRSRAATGWRPWLVPAALLAVMTAAPGETLRVGSKRFTESTILGEILTQAAQRTTSAEHVPGIGNTAIVAAALRSGAIDLYPEYLGTIELEILHHDRAGESLDQVDRELAPLGLGVGIPLGFQNSYAIGVRRDTAQALHLQSIGDLAGQPRLRLGLSHEFLGRADGWPALARHYGLTTHPSGLDHGLAYEALAAGQVDAIDLYTTDAKIARYGIQVLRDDRGFFPRYDAVVMYGRSVPQRFPRAWAALQALAGTIDETRMIDMNGAAELDHRPARDIARSFLAQSGQAAAATTFRELLFGEDFGRLARQHVMLVLLSVLAASAVGIPLGVAAARWPRLGAAILAAVGTLQTIPALALLAALIPLLGAIGTRPALLALFIFALLPIVRNTAVGLSQVPDVLRQAATALGARSLARLWLVELPLALPVILAGIRTAAVISVGTATIAAFVGAGGFGERISIGLALNDNRMLLAGALPAAALALALEVLFSLLERLSRGLGGDAAYEGGKGFGFARALLAFIALPGIVAFVVPAWLLAKSDATPVHPLGLLLLLVGVAGLLRCVRDFHVSGKGTLAPWDPPTRLVIVGLYRYTRNPMYLSVTLVLLGWAFWFGSVNLLVYAVLVTAAFHLRVVLGEEPWLARTHGELWQQYAARVPRWLGRGSFESRNTGTRS